MSGLGRVFVHTPVGRRTHSASIQTSRPSPAPPCWPWKASRARDCPRVMPGGDVPVEREDKRRVAGYPYPICLIYRSLQTWYQWIGVALL